MLFRPLALLPRRGTNDYSPEMRLVRAVFEDAIRSAVRNPTVCNRRERRECLDARAWVQDSDRDWPFAFANVCDLLGLDASAVRQRVLCGRISPDPDRRRDRRARSERDASGEQPCPDEHQEGHETSRNPAS